MRVPIIGNLLATLVLLATTPVGAASTCPNVVTFDPTPGESTADSGWTGIGHDRPIFGNILRLAVDCAPDDAPCGTCAVTGLLPDAQGMFQRCLNDTSIPCTTGTEVVDCGAVDQCAVFLTVPQEVPAGGVTACYTHQLTDEPTGTVDVESGALSVALSYRSRLYQWSTSSGACPNCVGDPVANDGIRGGTCSSGPRTGLGCDGHGPSPAPWDELGVSSFDCPLEPLTIISIQDHGPRTFATGTQSLTLSAASPNCTGAPGLACFCNTCNSGDDAPCTSNADCPDPDGPIGPICGGLRCVDGPNDGAPCTTASQCPGGGCIRPGEPTQPHRCLDDTTTPDDCTDTPPFGDGKGHCLAGPITQSCSNHPNRGCTHDADCDGVPGACSSENYACFVTAGTVGDVLPVTGIATPPVGDVSEPTVLGVIGCLGATGIAAINNVIGFPGPLRNVHVGRLTFPGSIPAPACPPSVDACRTPTVPGKSQLQVKDLTPDAKDQVRWRWSKGAATTVADFGNPTGTDHYDLCVYDGGGLVASMAIPAGGLCGGHPCWRASAKGFRYKNKAATPRGITKLSLTAGETGKASIQIAGKGDALPLLAPSTLQAPLNVQLRHRATGVCWGATYAAPFKRLTATDLKAVD